MGLDCIKLAFLGILDHVPLYTSWAIVSTEIDSGSYPI